MQAQPKTKLLRNIAEVYLGDMWDMARASCIPLLLHM